MNYWLMKSEPDEVSVDDRAAEAIRSAYGWAHAVGAVLAVAALVPAWYLRRARSADVRR